MFLISNAEKRSQSMDKIVYLQVQGKIISVHDKLKKIRFISLLNNAIRSSCCRGRTKLQCI